MQPKEEATRLLDLLNAGDVDASNRLLALVYEELRALAGAYFRGQRANHTLQPTALVHEAFIRLIDQSSVQFASRRHFMAVAALAMRQILADHARRVGAGKRGGDWQRIGVEDLAAGGSGGDVDPASLHEALECLSDVDARQARVVELRFFGGLTMEEIAEVIGVSKTTVELDWRAARAWLGTRLRT